MTSSDRSGITTSAPGRGTGIWTVYILECADGTLYTGITNDLGRRMSEHEKGRGSRYTRGRGPFHLVYHEITQGRGPASRRELEIKKLGREQKLGLVAESPGRTGARRFCGMVG